MMKKIINILLIAIFLLTMYGCSKQEEKVKPKDTASVSNSKSNESTEDEKNGKVLLDDEYVKITYTGINQEGSDGPELSLIVENKSEQKLLIQSDKLIMNGYSVDPIFSCDIDAGKKEKDTMSFLQKTNSDYKLYKVHLETLEGTFTINKSDTKENLKSEPFELKFYHTTSDEETEEEKMIFNNDYLKVSYIGKDDREILLKIENKTSNRLYFRIQDLVVNGSLSEDRFDDVIYDNEIIKMGVDLYKNASILKSVEGNIIISDKVDCSNILKEEPFSIKY